MKECKACNAIAVLFMLGSAVVQFPGIVLGVLWGLKWLIIGKIFRSERLQKYGWNTMIVHDQVLNVAFGGDPDETVSSRSGKLQKKRKWAEILCWFLNKLDTEHCKKSVELDEGDDGVAE